MFSVRVSILLCFKFSIDVLTVSLFLLPMGSLKRTGFFGTRWEPCNSRASATVEESRDWEGFAGFLASRGPAWEERCLQKSGDVIV